MNSLLHRYARIVAPVLALTLSISPVVASADALTDLSQKVDTLAALITQAQDSLRDLTSRVTALEPPAVVGMNTNTTTTAVPLVPADSSSQTPTTATTTTTNSPLVSVLTSDLIDYWNFDTGYDSQLVAQGKGGGVGSFTNHGATLTAGHNNAAVTFVPKAYLSISDTAALRPAALTIAVWVKVNQHAPDNTSVLIGKAQGGGVWQSFSLSINKDLHFRLGLENQSQNQYVYFVASSTVPTGVWQHVVATAEPSSAGLAVAMYVNGNPIPATADTAVSSYTPKTFTIGYGSGALVLGAHSARDQYYFNGQLDDLRLYSRALTPDEVQTIYRAEGIALHASSPAKGIASVSRRRLSSSIVSSLFKMIFGRR